VYYTVTVAVRGGSSQDANEFSNEEDAQNYFNDLVGYFNPRTLIKFYSNGATVTLLDEAYGTGTHVWVRGRG
jgi:hypothetical protein